MTENVHRVQHCDAYSLRYTCSLPEAEDRIWREDRRPRICLDMAEDMRIWLKIWCCGTRWGVDLLCCCRWLVDLQQKTWFVHGGKSNEGTLLVRLESDEVGRRC